MGQFAVHLGCMIFLVQQVSGPVAELHDYRTSVVDVVDPDTDPDPLYEVNPDPDTDTGF